MPDAESSAILPGVLPREWIVDAFARGIITSDDPVGPEQIQPNSLDLRLSRVGYRVQCSFLPGHEGLTSKLDRFRWYEVPVPPDGAVLERNQVYLFPLMESVVLPDDVTGRGNPKSTIGRLDIFTRLVTEYGDAFDATPAGYSGRLYLEVVPRSFAVRVRPGDLLAQIRFQRGEPLLSDTEIAVALDQHAIIIHRHGNAMRAADLRVASGIFLSVHLTDPRDITIGFRARKNTPPVDLRAPGTLSVRRHWERLYSQSSAPIILQPDEFYIFSSQELVRIPPAFCAEMVPYDAGSGELRTHYAGFFDSGFGYAPQSNAGLTAAAVVLEIRNRDVPFLLEEGHPLFRVTLLRNTATPGVVYGAASGSSYQGQRLRLSKQFRFADDDDAPRQGRLDFAG